MSVSDAREVLLQLISQTKEERIQWEFFGEAVAEYEAQSPKFRYYIRSRDADDSAPFIFEIWRSYKDSDKKNVKIDDVVTVSGSPLNAHLSELYGLAKMSALGMKSIKNDVLEDLT